MRKIIIALLLTALQLNMAFAASNKCAVEGTNNEAKKNNCKTKAGCQWDEALNGCRECLGATYKGSGMTKCTACSSNASGIIWNDETMGLESLNNCKFSITCKPGEYFAGYDIGCSLCATDKIHYGTKTTTYTITGTVGNNASLQNFNTACKVCGQNSSPNTNSGISCICNEGYRVKGKKNNITESMDGTDCEPKVYTITYNNSTLTKTISHSIYHGQAVTLLEGKNLPPGFITTGYELSKWTLQYSPTQYTPGETIQNGFTSNTTLIAEVSPKKFTVTYNVNGADNCALSNQGCTYGKSGCTAPDVKNCTRTGHTFGGWICTGCNSGVSTITIDTDISKLSDGNDMVLTANWVKCSAGKYCTNIATELPCPAGSTSKAGSIAITHCYMTGGTTEICDINNKCFTLPGTNQIYYHDGK
jgi:uncharacterized repeat protein (TIGR02543 family)